ncbi:hypothetical protein TNCT_464301 [Trichonephila clavata]|uniref:Uncharacterized protein n=1 Tax=Trichonephila clavata TaxID=2740835 RepID=A0A8X6GKF3_TRICU|nr:hypothetical protein TNCT_464301 [Trichonephila clavata]
MNQFTLAAPLNYRTSVSASKQTIKGYALSYHNQTDGHILIRSKAHYESKGYLNAPKLRVTYCSESLPDACLCALTCSKFILQKAYPEVLKDRKP